VSVHLYALAVLPLAKDYAIKVVLPVHTMKAYGGSRGMAPVILKLTTDGGEWLTSGPGRFTLGKKKPGIGRCGPEGRSGRFGKKKYIVNRWMNGATNCVISSARPQTTIHPSSSP
jgi:hypothetical protein